LPQPTPLSTDIDLPEPSKTTTSKYGTFSRRTPAKYASGYYAFIANGDDVEILCGIPEGSRLSLTLFGICAEELIHELRAKLPEFKFVRITSVDDFN